MKMKEEEFNLKWSAYTDHLSQMLQDLMINQSYTDVTLVCDDKYMLNAHKIVLSASSTFFERILNNDSDSKPIVYLRGIKFQEMKSILDFIYLGEASFLKERSSDFIKVAFDLGLKAICQDAKDEILDKTEVSNTKALTYSKEVDDQNVKLPHDIIDLSMPVFDERNNKENENFEISYVTEEQDNRSGVFDADAFIKKGLPTKANSKVQQTHIDKTNEIEKPVFDERNNKENENFEISYVTEDQDYRSGVFDADAFIKKGLSTKANSKVKQIHNDKTNEIEKPKESDHNQKQLVKDNSNKYCTTAENKIQSDINATENKAKNHCCIACNVSFSNMGKLLNHCRTYHKGVPNMCNRCAYQALDKAGLRKHKLDVHNYKTCSECDFIAYTAYTVEDHIVEYHRGLKKKCKDCDFIGGRREIVKHRYNNHQVKESEPYSCQKCDFTNLSLGEINRHIDSVHKDQDGKITYSCEKCKFTCTLKYSLDRHMVTKHSDDSSENYVLKLAENGKKVFFCTECDYQNPERTNIRRHVDIHHLGISYTCEHCGYQATRRGILNAHIQTVHGEKRFACEQCGKKYTKRDILQNHVNSAHLGIFYPCTLCKSVHNRKSNLDKHIRKYHS